MSEFAVALTAMIIAGVAVVVSLFALGYAHRQTKAAESSADSAQRAADAGRDSADSAKVSADAAAETARIALEAEKNAQTGWTIERISRDRYALRNTGTLSAHEVELRGNFDPLCFDIQNPQATVDIGPGQSATFWAAVDMQNSGGDVVITWRNQVVRGQAALTPRTHWVEQLPA
jgi:hypothetical protein